MGLLHHQVGPCHSMTIHAMGMERRHESDLSDSEPEVSRSDSVLTVHSWRGIIEHIMLKRTARRRLPAPTRPLPSK